MTTSWLKRVWEKADYYGFILTLNNLSSSFPQEGNNWLMARFITMGCIAAELLILNQVRKHQQVLFLFDIIGAEGGSLDKRYLSKRPQGERWSSMKFPCEVVIETEMGLWRRAVLQVVAHGPMPCCLGIFKTDGHKVWEWRVLENQGRLFQQHRDQVKEYGHIRQGRYKRVHTSRSGRMPGAVATVEEVKPGMMKVCSVVSPPIRPIPPANFLDVLPGWGQTWIWEDLKVTRRTDWVAQTISENSLVAVTDGYYIKEHYSDLCSAAFVLECMQGCGRAIGTFPEASAAANVYWGELLGLMAVHLLLLAVNTVSPGLSGCVKIYSDCLGALGRVAKLPPDRIPTQCRHSDILKTVLVNCGGLSFHQEYCHVEAHQDNCTRWEDLFRAAQLNAACDAGAKAML